MANKDAKYLHWAALVLIALAGIWYIRRYLRAENNILVSESMVNANVQAFLKTLRFAEGTAGVNGYKTLFGGKLFNDFSKHPNVKGYFFNKAKNKQDYTTAAGAYQFIYPTWETLRKRLNLTDFSPASQDKGAIELIREKGALEDVREGRFTTAVSKVRLIWASLPGAGYQQPEKSLADLQKVFRSNGGTIV